MTRRTALLERVCWALVAAGLGWLVWLLVRAPTAPMVCARAHYEAVEDESDAPPPPDGRMAVHLRYVCDAVAP